MKLLVTIALSLMSIAALRAGESPVPVVVVTAPDGTRQAPLMTRWSSQVSRTDPLPEYPRPQLVRTRWLSLNGPWEFAPAAADAPVPVGTTLPERILVPFPVESALSGVMRHEERMWYRRMFTVPAEWRGERVLLHFGAVDWKATVYCNGREVGGHEGGYGAFSIDLTDRLKPGDNELIVNVFDPTDRGRQPVGKQSLQPRGYWYTACSGIWQTVWLEPVPAAHLTRLDPSPDVPGGTLRLVAQGQGIDGQTVEAVASAGGVVVGRASGEVGKELALPIPQPHLWSPDDPFLYDLVVTLKKGDTEIDRVASYFGMRSIALGKVGGITRPLLNGAFVFQLGTLDQGYWPDGVYTAPTDEALRYDLEQEKRLGYNTVRKHIKVESARWYHWADRLGLLVWQDMPAMAADGINADGSIRKGYYASNGDERKRFASEFHEMVDQLRASPAIIGWIEFNENWGEYREKDEVRRLADAIKAQDPSRLLVVETGTGDAGGGDACDWHTYPGPGSPPPTDSRCAGQGEFGGLGFVVKDHSWTPVNHDETTVAKYTARYVDLIGKLKALMYSPGLSYAFFTQITDVENERNGLLTYDRAVSKVDPAMVKAAHDDLIAASRTLGQTFATVFSGDVADPGLWAMRNGAWKADQGALVASAAGVALAKPCFVDLSADLDVTVPAAGEAGLVFRFAGEAADGHGYCAGISVAAGLTLSYGDHGVWTPITVVPMPVAAGRSCHVRVDACGCAIRVFVDDLAKPALDVTDHRSLAGAVGLRTTGADARFAGFAAADPFVRLKPLAVDGFVIHDSRDKELVHVDKNVNRDDDACWRLVPGLADPHGVSFASARLPGFYLRDRDGTIVFEKDDGSSGFKEGATWKRSAGLADPAGASYESLAHPGEYLRGQRPMVRKPAVSAQDRSDATLVEMR